MKVSSLIEVLKSYDQDYDVVIEWEAMWSDIEAHGSDEEKRVVWLDASEWGSHK